MMSRALAKKADTHEATRAAILAKALARAAGEGWTDVMLAHAAKAARLSPALARIAFPRVRPISSLFIRRRSTARWWSASLRSIPRS